MKNHEGRLYSTFKPKLDCDLRSTQGGNGNLLVAEDTTVVDEMYLCSGRLHANRGPLSSLRENPSGRDKRRFKNHRCQSHIHKVAP